MRIAAVRDGARNRDDQRGYDEGDCHDRSESARERDAAPQPATQSRAAWATRSERSWSPGTADGTTRYGTNAITSRQQRAPFAQQHDQRTDRGGKRHSHRERDRGPREHQRLIEGDGEMPRRRSRPQHVDPREVLASLRMECGQVGVDAATGDDKRDAPRETAGGKCRDRPATTP